MVLKKYRKEIVALGFLLAALVLTGVVLTWGHDSLEIPNVWVFLLKLLPFACAAAFIALFPLDRLKTPLKLLAVLGAFGVIFAFFIGKLIYYFLERPVWVEFYLLLQFMTPVIILSLALALRCGGMKTRDVAVFGATGIVFMVSGIEDLVSQIVRMVIVPGYAMPATWDWARHMTVFIGHVPTQYEAYAFIAVHFALIALILYVAYAKNNVFLRLGKRLTARLRVDQIDRS
jgi:hypothetical protein